MPKHLGFAAVAVLAAAFACLLYASSAFDPNRDPHAYFASAAACPKCHATAGGKPDPERLLADSPNFCFGCHTESRLGRSHPIGVRPSDKYWKMKVPDDFRLDEDGRLTCLTCHAAHRPFVATVKSFLAQKPENPGAGPAQPLFYKTFYLRRSDPRVGFAALCDACHKYL